MANCIARRTEELTTQAGVWARNLHFKDTGSEPTKTAPAPSLEIHGIHLCFNISNKNVYLHYILLILLSPQSPHIHHIFSQMLCISFYI